jgi:hypothetical protein
MLSPPATESGQEEGFGGSSQSVAEPGTIWYRARVKQ